MFEYLYEWLRNISFYLILMTAVTHVLPGNGYKKYIRFFTGLVLISMLLMPVIKIFGSEIRMNEAYEMFYKELGKRIRENDFVNDGYYVPDEIEDDNNRYNEIEVEEIVIGP